MTQHETVKEVNLLFERVLSICAKERNFLVRLSFKQMMYNVSEHVSFKNTSQYTLKIFIQIEY